MGGCWRRWIEGSQSLRTETSGIPERQEGDTGPAEQYPAVPVGHDLSFLLSLAVVMRYVHQRADRRFSVLRHQQGAVILRLRTNDREPDALMAHREKAAG
jgi:hypothetical protein